MQTRDSFPIESVQEAQRISQKYHQRSSSPLMHAAYLYDGKFLEIGYGFTEALRTGNCGRFLHEIKREADCFTMAGALYLVARESGLKPRIFWGTGIRDVSEGKDPRDSQRADHGFITVQTAKGEEYIVDPHMGLFGKLFEEPNKSQMRVHSKKSGKVTLRDYRSMKELTESDYIGLLEESRSPQGGRIALTSTQKVQVAGRKVSVGFNPSTSTLRSSLRYDCVNLLEEPYKRFMVEDLDSSVDQNGNFDFNNGSLRIYHAVNLGWTEHEGAQIPFNIPMSHALQVWNLWEDLFLESGRKSSPQRMTLPRLEEAIFAQGFRENLSLAKDSPAENYILQRGLTKKMQELIEGHQRIVNDFLENTPKDEISHKVLLRDAHYRKALSASRLPDQQYGLASTPIQRNEFVKSQLKNYRRAMAHLLRTLSDDMEEKVSEKRTSDWHTHRKFNQKFEHSTKSTKPVDMLTNLRNFHSKFPWFDLVVDRAIFYQNYDLPKQTVAELEKGLVEEDIQRVAHDYLFYRTIGAFRNKDAILLTSLQPGLRRILAVK